MNHVELVNGVPVVGGDRSPTHADSTNGRTRPKASANSYCNTISHTNLLPPLDYSFQDLTSMTQLIEHEPNGGRKVPSSPTKSVTSPNAVASSPSSSSSSSSGAKLHSSETGIEIAGRKAAKSILTGIRLSYNELTNLKGFTEAIEAVMGPGARQQLTWLDLSHNKLTNIDEAIFAFPNLTHLYLHGNCISHLTEVRKLQSLEKLQKLTLHGNPLYQSRENHGLKHPRSGIIYQLRNCVLKSLDDVVITDVDRRNSLRWAEQNSSSPKKKRAHNDEETDGSRR